MQTSYPMICTPNPSENSRGYGLYLIYLNVFESWLSTYFFEKLLEFLRFLLLPLEIPEKTKLHPKTPQNCVTSLGNFKT